MGCITSGFLTLLANGVIMSTAQSSIVTKTSIKNHAREEARLGVHRLREAAEVAKIPNVNFLASFVAAAVGSLFTRLAGIMW